MCTMFLCLLDLLIMQLKIDSDICLLDIKGDLSHDIKNGKLKNSYSYEINLIYKVIHEYSNYEEFQWSLFSKDIKFVKQNLGSLLLEISSLDRSLAWDCMSVLSRYENLYERRHQIAKKYLR